MLKQPFKMFKMLKMYVLVRYFANILDIDPQTHNMIIRLRTYSTMRLQFTKQTHIQPS